MAPSGSEIAAKGAKLSSDGGAGADGLSALPDDVLVLILLRLDSAAAAGRTSVLSKRWRRIWSLVPELLFPAGAPAPDLMASALASHEAALRHLLVGVEPESAAASCWLPVAARRLTGRLTIQRRVKEDGGTGGETRAKGGFFELLCFERATAVSVVDLGFGLALPPAGVFAHLTSLSLTCVRFQGPCELGDAVSSPRCPCLQKLTVRRACGHGLAELAISSESLLELRVQFLLGGLRRLTVVAPALKDLELDDCFARDRRPVADVAAPQLVSIMWRDQYDPSSVMLGNLVHLNRLAVQNFHVYEHGDNDSVSSNRGVLLLLERVKVKVIRDLRLELHYPKYIGDSRCLMKDFTVLPRPKILILHLVNRGHAFGASLFHVLSMCTGLELLALRFYGSSELEAQSACPSGCVCDQPSNWKTEELNLNHLEEVDILDSEGTDLEVAFVMRLFSWARKLKRIVLLYRPISLNRTKEVREKLLSYAVPETCTISLMKFPLRR